MVGKISNQEKRHFFQKKLIELIFWGTILLFQLFFSYTSKSYPDFLVLSQTTAIFFLPSSSVDPIVPERF